METNPNADITNGWTIRTIRFFDDSDDDDDDDDDDDGSSYSSSDSRSDSSGSGSGSSGNGSGSGIGIGSNGSSDDDTCAMSGSCPIPSNTIVNTCSSNDTTAPKATTTQ